MKKLIIIMMFVMTIPLLAQIGKPTKEAVLIYASPTITLNKTSPTVAGTDSTGFMSVPFAITTDSIAFIIEIPDSTTANIDMYAVSPSNMVNPAIWVSDVIVKAVTAKAPYFEASKYIGLPYSKGLIKGRIKNTKVTAQTFWYKVYKVEKRVY